MTVPSACLMCSGLLYVQWEALKSTKNLLLPFNVVQDLGAKKRNPSRQSVELVILTQ